MSQNVSVRAQKLMKVLVEQYMRHGQPMGSSTLAKMSDLSVSPATIRNIMGELEQQGLVESPHTSAGRIPTNQGYRLYVDHLLTVKGIEHGLVKQFSSELNAKKNSQELFTGASHLLSEFTKMAGLVKVPSRKINRIKQIEFMPLTEKRILVILVLDDHDVQNRVIYTERRFTVTELAEATNFVNQHLAGQEIRVARQTLLSRMKQEKAALNEMMQLAIELASESLEDDSNDDKYHLTGDNHLLDFASESGIHNLKAVFDAFRQKQDVLALLDKALHADGVQIYIGEESATEGLDHYSVISAPYQAEGKAVGVLAVVGPTRMRYDKVIPIVDITAKLLSSALNQSE